MLMFRILLSVLSIVSMPSAQASQVSQIELSAAAASQSIQMTDQKFEPIIESQPYEATCDRQVLDHVETICSTVNDSVCHGTDGEVCETQSDKVCNSQGCTEVPRKVCHQEQKVCETVPRRVCSDNPVMRTEYYSCTQYHDVVVGQRLVKTFQHSVEVSVDRPELLQGQSLVISLLAREDSVAPTLVSSFSLNMLTFEQAVSNSDNGTIEQISSRILVHVDSPTALIGKILSSSVQNLSLSAAGISMTIPGMAELSQDLMIAIKLTQHRFLIGDKKLFNDTIASESISPVTQGDDLKVTIPLAKMNIGQLKSTRHNLSISISLKRPALSILNANDLAAVINKRLEASISNVTP